jgi:hypothetical protein
MTKRRAWGIVGALVLATTALMGTVSASAASSSAPVEHFLGLNNNPNIDGVQVIIATGPIHARGKDVVVSSHRDRFVFPNGAVKIFHTATKNHQTFDKTTCYGTFTERGTYRVTGGTGAYRGASGHGTYTVHAAFVGCSQTKPPSIFQLVLKAKGPLHI